MQRGVQGGSSREGDGQSEGKESGREGGRGKERKNRKEEREGVKEGWEGGRAEDDDSIFVGSVYTQLMGYAMDIITVYFPQIFAAKNMYRLESIHLSPSITLSLKFAYYSQQFYYYSLTH